MFLNCIATAHLTPSSVNALLSGVMLGSGLVGSFRVPFAAATAISVHVALMGLLPAAEIKRALDGHPVELPIRLLLELFRPIPRCYSNRSQPPTLLVSGHLRATLGIGGVVSGVFVGCFFFPAMSRRGRRTSGRVSMDPNLGARP